MRDRRARMDRVAELLRLVGLRPEFMHRFPHASAAASASGSASPARWRRSPRLVVADEPVSALDVSVQAQVLNLLLELQERLRLTYLFVAHDLSVVKHMSDRVAVMYVGQLVETAPTAAIFAPAAASLHGGADARGAGAPIRACPAATSRCRGEVPSPANPPPGCYFHPRCSFAVERCRMEPPVLRAVAPGHLVRCHLAEELALEGVGEPSAAG